MTDLTRFHPAQLNAKDAVMREWQINLDRDAQAAQDEADRKEFNQKLLTTGGPQPS